MVTKFVGCGHWKKSIFSECEFAPSNVIQAGGNNEDPLKGPSGLQAQSSPISEYSTVDIEENYKKQSSPLMLSSNAVKKLDSKPKKFKNPKSCQRKREKTEIVTSSSFKKRRPNRPRRHPHVKGRMMAEKKSRNSFLKGKVQENKVRRPQ